MTSRVPQTSEDLAVHLDDHIGFLKASSSAFDSGFVGEAKRLAVTLRLLLHDTQNSVSLLGQLGKKESFVDTSFPVDPNNRFSHCGLVVILAGPKGSRFIAFLDEHPPGQNRLVGFDQWWSSPIFIDRPGNRISRRQLVLSVADTDGGAHVDPTLDEVYVQLSRKSSLGWVSYPPGGRVEMSGAHNPAIRQIAHEVLKTLDTTYTCMPVLEKGEVMAGGLTMTETLPGQGVHSLDARFVGIGRNEICPCGSGKKFKHCHGR